MSHQGHLAAAAVRITLNSLGCRVNQAEADALAARFRSCGYEIVSDPRLADVQVVNSCTVTHQADADTRRLVRRLRRLNPAASVVLTGCYATAAPELAAALPGVDLVVHNADKQRLCSYLQRLKPVRRDWVPRVDAEGPDESNGGAGLPAAPSPCRARAHLKVQDGCNQRCAFCIVPHVRGSSRSLPHGAVLEQLDGLLGAEVPEVVLTGVHLGAYGRDLRPRTNLLELLEQMLPRLGRARLRLGSFHPGELNRDLVDLLRTHPDKLCRHLHLSLQSGAPRVLRRMRRAPALEELKARVADLSGSMPELAVGADIIVGFPGEDDQAFDTTVQLVRDLPLAYLHVFRFSPRAGTAAAEMAEQVPEQTKRARSRQLGALARAKRRQFTRRFAGADLPAVVLKGRHRQSNALRLLTDNYIDVTAAGPSELMGRAVNVRIDAEVGMAATGQIL